MPVAVFYWVLLQEQLGEADPWLFALLLPDGQAMHRLL
jgi:hypothetical protein